MMVVLSFKLMFYSSLDTDVIICFWLYVVLILYFFILNIVFPGHISFQPNTYENKHSYIWAEKEMEQHPSSKSGDSWVFLFQGDVISCHQQYLLCRNAQSKSQHDLD